VDHQQRTRVYKTQSNAATPSTLAHAEAANDEPATLCSGVGLGLGLGLGIGIRVGIGLFVIGSLFDPSEPRDPLVELAPTIVSGLEIVVFFAGAVVFLGLAIPVSFEPDIDPLTATQDSTIGSRTCVRNMRLLTGSTQFGGLCAFTSLTNDVHAAVWQKIAAWASVGVVTSLAKSIPDALMHADVNGVVKISVSCATLHIWAVAKVATRAEEAAARRSFILGLDSISR
jgi:hypothetical protein